MKDDTQELIETKHALAMANRAIIELNKQIDEMAIIISYLEIRQDVLVINLNDMAEMED